MPVWNHRLRNAPFHHIKEGSLKTEPTCLDVSGIQYIVQVHITEHLISPLKVCMFIHPHSAMWEGIGGQAVSFHG